MVPIPEKLDKLLTFIVFFIWDTTLFFLNLILPKYKPGTFIPPGKPGHDGNWPEFVPPKEGDSRSACPMINAMANHGIIPHDGKNISFRELKIKIQQTFNFAPSFCFFVPKFAADFMNKSYFTDTFDLAELNLHAPNAIEHDASLTRHDLYHQKDQGYPDQKLVDELLAEATGTMPDGSRRLTIPDLSRALSKRRVDAQATNPEYTEIKPHRMFGSANSSTMLKIFGGRVDDLIPMLKEERFSDKWEPRVLNRFGLTGMQFNGTVIPVERGVNKAKYEHLVADKKEL